jgi:hypothetical protein
MHLCKSTFGAQIEAGMRFCRRFTHIKLELASGLQMEE